MDLLLAVFIKVCKVGCGKVLLLSFILLILLVLFLNAVYCCLCILMNLGVGSIGTLDDIGFFLED